MLNVIFKRCFFLYVSVFILIILLVNQDKIVMKALNYENVAPSFVAEFAQHQSGAFWYPRAEQALRYYRNLTRMFPDSPQAYGALAFCYYHYGDDRKAIRYYKKAIKLGPQVFGFYYNLGYVYVKLNMYDEAIAILKQAIEKSPYSTLEYPYVVIPDETGKGGGADRQQTMVNLRNIYEKCYKLMVFSLWSKKHYTAMLVIAKGRLANGSVDQGDYFYYAGAASFYLKQYKEAYHFLRQADKFNPQNQEVYELLSQSLQQLNLPEASDKILKLMKESSQLKVKGYLSSDQLMSSKLIYFVPVKPVKSNGKTEFIMI